MPFTRAASGSPGTVIGVGMLPAGEVAVAERCATGVGTPGEGRQPVIQAMMTIKSKHRMLESLCGVKCM